MHRNFQLGYQNRRTLASTRCKCEINLESFSKLLFEGHGEDQLVQESKR